MSIRIVGAGGAGIQVLDEWILLSDRQQGSVACDGEACAVEGSLASEKLLLAPDLAGGLGCFGSRDLAWRMVGQENRRLDALLKDCSGLLIVIGLAGATGATVAEALSLKAVEREIPTTVFAFPPFPFEPAQRRESAEATRAALPAEVSLFLFPPPAFFEDPLPGVAAVRRGLREFHGALAQWIGVWEGVANGAVRPILRGGGAEDSPFARGGRIDGCRLFGVAAAHLDFASPGLLDGAEFREAAEKADRCLAYVEGGDGLSGSCGELGRKLQEQLAQGTDLWLLQRTEEAPAENRLLLLVGRAASRHHRVSECPEEGRGKPEEPAAPARAAPEPEGVAAFPALEATPFAKTAATMYKGVNLDIPAFRRRRGSRFAKERPAEPGEA
ncbi:protein of unknown function [Methylacidimicrobium sp. AP8]|uniref:hypothetical protein n=1 Tax=Methylacidimicrobium sp. AP8 TaxID=2730359 RepID=UPI0018C18BFF|nr:hypothetical protein [Methylacidimicrobium sp. AP8]CAB4242949.1 protein of unknown function [Methylacidimicrobium sp. AP8]